MPRSASVRISAKFAGMISIPPSVKVPFHKVSSRSHTTSLTGSDKTTPFAFVNSLPRGQGAFRFYTMKSTHSPVTTTTNCVPRSLIGTGISYHSNLSAKQTNKQHFSEIFNDGGSVIGFPAAPRQIDRTAPLVALLLVATVTEAMFLLLPSFVGALGDLLHLSAARTGLLASADLTGIALATATAPCGLRRVWWRRTVLASLLAFLLINLLCFVLRSFWPLL